MGKIRACRGMSGLDIDIKNDIFSNLRMKNKILSTFFDKINFELLHDT